MLKHAHLVTPEMIARGELVDPIADGYWEWDLNNPEFIYMSPKYWTTLGYDPDTMDHTPSTWRDKIHPEDMVRAAKDFEDHMDPEKRTSYHLLVRYVHADGHWVWIICRGQAIFKSDGTADWMRGSHQDVTGVVHNNLPASVLAKESSEAALNSMERILNLLESKL